MRQLLLFALLSALALGCSKKKPAPEAGTEPEKEAPGDTLSRDRAHWLNGLKSKDFKVREEASVELAEWVKTDAETVNALVELLKDRATTGAGKVLPTRINSTREAAAVTLNRSGEKGQAALKERGLPILREGLSDPDAAIREHTLHTVGLLGTLAQSLSPDVLKLCTSPDANIRAAAFDTLKSIGGSDPVQLSAMLKNENREVVRLASEMLAGFSNIPIEAVPNLTSALAARDPAVRVAAANCLATAGPRAATAVDGLVKAIELHYPKEYNPMVPYEVGSEVAYWAALVSIGEPSVPPVAGLLAHTNPVVRSNALTTLARIGDPSKAVLPKIKEALKDPFGSVAIEAACTLCRLEEGEAEAVELVKRAMDAPNNVAQDAIEAIPRLGGAGKPLIPVALTKLSSENPYARYAAIGVVGTLEPAEAAKYLPDLGRLATDVVPKLDEPKSDRRGQHSIRLRVGVVLEKLGPAAAPAAEALAKAIPNEKDTAVREQFYDALMAMGPGAKSALPVLLAYASEPPPLERRVQVFESLVTIDPASKDVAALFMKTAKESLPAARVAGAMMLAKLDPVPQDALARLVEMANKDTATSARTGAIRALASAGPKAKPVRADIEKIAAGTLPEFALGAKVALAAMDGNLVGVAADVRKGLSDKNAQVRAVAVESLLLVGPTAADLSTLQRLLTEPGAATREAAARCVGALGEDAKDAVPHLVKLLDDREAAVRIAAATALGEIGWAAKPAVAKLRAMRGSTKRGGVNDPQAGPAAAKALEKLEGKGN